MFRFLEVYTKESGEECLLLWMPLRRRMEQCIVYMRSEFEDQTVSINLVAAKTRVAPFQSISIPRLELLGAI